MQLVSTFATQVAVLVDGHIRFCGPPAELLAQPTLMHAASLEPPPLWAIANHLQQPAKRCTSAPTPT
jgi:hypothetical protein